MARKHVVTVERLIDHPIEEVFRHYTDHAGWSSWVGLGKVRLVQEGSPHRDGVGAVRAFSAAPGLREEVTLFEPPQRMEYRVTRGAYPITDHHGEVLFTPDRKGTRVLWRVSFRSKLPGIGWALRGGIALVFRGILARLARELDGRA